ncbi:MAG: aminotransferase class V-fold PLP-dependent enzyme, partial [Candidatus Margulisiibacteriota bacterium]
MVGFNTKAIHAKGQKPDAHQALRAPIYAGVSYAFDTAEDIEQAFRGNRPSHMYSRISNPSVEVFENKMKALEDGLGTIAVASGMAAIANVLLAILQSGDNIIAANALFGGTTSLLKNVLTPMGIETRFADFDDLDQIRQRIDKNTRILFFETITNPQMKVHDISAIVKLAQANGIVVVVDSTVTTPYLFRSKDYGVNIVVHSSSKFISGGATSIGGVIVDMGNYDWTQIQKLGKFHRFKEWALLAKLRKEV